MHFSFGFHLAESRTALAMLATLLGIAAVNFENYHLVPLLLLFILFVAAIRTRWTWTVYLLLGFLISLKYFLVHPRIMVGFRETHPGDLMTVLTLVLFAAACFRYLQTARYLDAFYPNTKLGQKPRPEVKIEFPSLLGGRWWAIPLSVLIALALLGFFSFGNFAPGDLRIDPRTSRLIFLTLALFFAWFICRALIGTLIRRRMNPNQADVYCRSLVAKEFWKDTYNIEKRCVKQRSKEEKKRNPR